MGDIWTGNVQFDGIRRTSCRQALNYIGKVIGVFARDIDDNRTIEATQIRSLIGEVVIDAAILQPDSIEDSRCGFNDALRRVTQPSLTCCGFYRYRPEAVKRHQVLGFTAKSECPAPCCDRVTHFEGADLHGHVHGAHHATSHPG